VGKITSVVTGGIAAAVAALAMPAVAQQAQTTLPELSVTAPKTQPEPAPGMAPTQGMLGKTRVEEDKWPEIPCGDSRMVTAAAATQTGAAGPGDGRCQDGPKVQNFLSIAGGGDHPNAYGDCRIVHPLITAVVGRFAVEADVLVFDPYKITAGPYNGKCTVWSGFEHLPQDFRDMNQVTRRGVSWHNFVGGNGQPGTQSTMEFADGERSCLALERLGPPWHGGFVWVMHAAMCQDAGAAVTPITLADIDAVAHGLQIQVYDPVGNLVPPPAR
jgi:hypothetical protein